MPDCISENFNEQSLCAVINRVNAIDVLQEPLIIKVEAGNYIVHERNGLPFLKNTSLDQRDGVVSYSQEEFDETFGDKRLMTYDQYVEDQAVLSDNRRSHLIDETTRSQFMYMHARIEEVQKDMLAVGETFDSPSSQIALEPNNFQ